MAHEIWPLLHYLGQKDQKLQYKCTKEFWFYFHPFCQGCRLSSLKILSGSYLWTLLLCGIFAY